MGVASGRERLQDLWRDFPFVLQVVGQVDGGLVRNWDVHPDGSRFIMVASEGGEAGDSGAGLTEVYGPLQQLQGEIGGPECLAACVDQPHGGALRRGNPGNRGGGRPSHAVKQALCGDLELAHQRILSLLYDPSLRFTDLLDLYGELLTRLEKYGF